MTTQKQKTYFQENQEDFRVEEQVNVKFIRVNPASLVTSEEVEAYYKENQKEFMTSESVKASHILKQFPEDATDEQKAETKTAAEELLKTVNAELAAGTDFAELAKEHSDDTSAAQGGDLGYFERGRMVKPFEEAAFDTLSPGEVSGLVETMSTDTISSKWKKKRHQKFDLLPMLNTKSNKNSFR